jgi:hypothetical protein
MLIDAGKLNSPLSRIKTKFSCTFKWGSSLLFERVSQNPELKIRISHLLLRF